MACAMGTVPYAMAYSSAAAGGERGGGKVGSVEAGSLNLLFRCDCDTSFLDPSLGSPARKASHRTRDDMLTSL